MNLVLTESRYLRFFSFTIFYIAQGLPFGLVSYALPAFLAERQTAPGAIASFIAISSLPWSFKLFAGPLMDRFSFLAMGRRRPWVILAQLGMVLTGLAFAFFPNGLDDIVVLTSLCFLLNCFSATQDVAVDGMAIDVLPVAEHGRANAFMAFGQVLGISGSSAISAFVLLSYGLQGVAVMLLIGFGLILFWSIAVRERANEKVLPWTPGQATERSLSMHAESWKEIGVNLSKVLFLPASLLLLCASFLFRFADGFWITLAPIVVVQELGYQSTEYSSFTALTGLVAATAGLFVGFFIDKKGVKLLYMSALLLYGVLAAVVGLTGFAWASPRFLIGIGVLQAFIYQGVFISFIAIHMNLCWVKVAATQFALYMAWVNLARSLGAGALSGLQESFSYNQMFCVIAVAFFIATALLWKVNLTAHQQKVQALERA
jgi:PAT family beta-lactamase induction signal transducer AmpG